MSLNKCLKNGCQYIQHPKNHGYCCLSCYYGINHGVGCTSMYPNKNDIFFSKKRIKFVFIYKNKLFGLFVI